MKEDLGKSRGIREIRIIGSIVFGMVGSISERKLWVFIVRGCWM